MAEGKSSHFSLQLKYKQLLLLQGAFSRLPEDSKVEHIYGFILS